MSSFKMFRISVRVYDWRKPKEVCNPECLVPTVKYGGEYVTVWAAITRYSAGPISTLNGRNTASNYVDILGKQVPSVFHMLFPNNDVIFKNYNSPPPPHTHTHSQKLSVLVWGAWRCISTYSLSSKIARHKNHRSNVVIFRGQGEKIPSSTISQATLRCSPWRVVKYSTREYSELMRVHSTKDANCI